ncbi:Flp pilus assembly protein CpaB [Rhodoblastus sphagnicola]|uniref:Flp pilus assembly protein CpaB n=1 Tax=Rhodoblastus sphagnicola TaxID=333368 RepID=A0A2S6N5J3_9HYPH|nr:Flp pilus assembly protein CpaB [Rhodoblastus sphagnicola]MBB4197279.1 pilus assembly protein CpaB [Rhodoblastus sphagnicola]PPQ29881.1 Flp pilus assembly protein CpaB [Rhodoblastus sphagnicola]
MKRARLISLGFVAVCGLAAIYLVLDKPEPAPAPAPVVIAPPPVPKDQILVATHELNFGSVIQPADVNWQDWPKDSPIQGVIRKVERPNAIEEVKESVVRGSFLAGEPLRAERLFKGASSGFLSAVLAPGYRAVAINIEGSGATTAGNFVLPNDRVDVVHIYRDDDAAKSGAGDAFVSETLVTNVRVLAIGQNANDKGGPPTTGGSTATLELDPYQAETIILAQRVGQLSLILRSMQDSAKQAGGSVSVASQTRDRGVTIVRAGIATQSRGK